MKSLRDWIGLALCFVLLLTVGGGSAWADDKKPGFRLPNPTPTKVYQTFVKAGGNSWDAVLTQLPQAWAVTKGAGVRIAVLDTGVDADHPEIKGRVVASKDFTGSPVGARDRQGHGTHCSTIAAGSLQVDGGAPEASLLMGKVLADNGSGDFDWLTRGILWAIEEKADVISMSIGSGPNATPPDQFDPSLQAALRKAKAAGIIILAAAGNEGPVANTTGYPARFPECLSVAACDKDRVITDFSSRGADVYITSPGKAILGGLPNGKYAEWDGTSMATPKVAGIAALYVAHCRAIGKAPSQDDFKRLVRESSTTKNPNPPSASSGYGLIQAAAILAKNGPIDPNPPPTGNKPFKLTVNMMDLLPQKQFELKAIGVNSLNLTVEGTTPTAPTFAAASPRPIPPQENPAYPRPGDTLGRLTWEFLPHTGGYGWVDRGGHTGPGTLTGEPIRLPFQPTTVCPEAYPPSVSPGPVPATMPGCPGGVCPPQSARSLRGVGSWFVR